MKILQRFQIKVISYRCCLTNYVKCECLQCLFARFLKLSWQLTKLAIFSVSCFLFTQQMSKHRGKNMWNSFTCYLVVYRFHVASENVKNKRRNKHRTSSSGKKCNDINFQFVDKYTEKSLVRPTSKFKQVRQSNKCCFQNKKVDAKRHCQLIWNPILKDNCLSNRLEITANCKINIGYSTEIKHLRYLIMFFREKVRTTKITTLKTKKNSENSVDDQNVEMVFLVDQNVKIRTSKMSFELIRLRRSERQK